MLEPLLFPLLLAVTFRLRPLAPFFVLGFWANLLWFVYQNEWGSGWLTYLRGLGAGLFLAAGYGEPLLAWSLLPWPLLLYAKLQVRELLPYLPGLTEGLGLGLLLYLLGFRKR